MLRHTNIDGRGNHYVQGFGHSPGEQLRAQGIGADETVRSMLFGGPQGHYDTRGPFQIGLDLGPGAKLHSHDDRLPKRLLEYRHLGGLALLAQPKALGGPNRPGNSLSGNAMKRWGHKKTPVIRFTLFRLRPSFTALRLLP